MDKSVLLMSAVLASASLEASAQAKDKSPNIVFVLADDMGIGDLGCYGQKQIKSPNIDHWAAQSVLFNRAYCNIAVSGASRASLLTGLRPTKKSVTGLEYPYRC